MFFTMNGLFVSWFSTQIWAPNMPVCYSIFFFIKLLPGVTTISVGKPDFLNSSCVSIDPVDSDRSNHALNPVDALHQELGDTLLRVKR